MADRWEYCQVVIAALIDGQEVAAPTLHRWTAQSGVAIEELADAYQAMAALGNDGWELAGYTTEWAVVMERAMPVGQCYTFKRVVGCSG